MRLAKASIYLSPSDLPFLVAESPHEVTDAVQVAIDGGYLFVCLTLGNESEWNGKPVFVRADAVLAVSPPKTQDCDPDDDED